MAKSVGEAFNIYMKDIINLNPETVKSARKSRDNLLENISEFRNNDFFNLHEPYNIQFGSFARKTKCRNLDDIDLMIGIAGDGSTYDEYAIWDNITINTLNCSNYMQQECSNNDGTLNSTIVTNRFKSKIEKLREYKNSEVKRNGEAVRLNLLSREWAFDIVPCFHTVPDSFGKEYYLIPNGKGNWKKTDPIIDRDKIKKMNEQHGYKLTPLIRLVKKWNKVKNVETITSYLMETMLYYHANQANEIHEHIGIRFANALDYIKTKIFYTVEDMKNIQGNINNLERAVMEKLSEKASNDLGTAIEALEAEIDERNHKKAINLWRNIFGQEFPAYE